MNAYRTPTHAMRRRWPQWLLFGALLACTASPGPAEHAGRDPASVEAEWLDRIRTTSASNLDGIIAGQFFQPAYAHGFSVPNPYPAGGGSSGTGPVHHRRVQAWLDDPGSRAEVCAIRFLDAGQARYLLHTFASAAAAEDAGYHVTHQYRCGSCSSLSDLAVYLETPDLTSPARACARRWTAGGIQRCLVERIGFSDACAESWAYNALNTRRACRDACIEAYGLLNLLLRRYPAPNNNPDGSLNACLQCDEDFSGPGFKYSAGRTRRGSGIRSAIARPDDALFPVDHAAYFTDP